MNNKIPDNLKIKLDDATYAVVKEQFEHAYSKIEETKTGFIYTVDFRHQPE